MTLDELDALRAENARLRARVLAENSTPGASNGPVSPADVPASPAQPNVAGETRAAADAGIVANQPANAGPALGLTAQALDRIADVLWARAELLLANHDLIDIEADYHELRELSAAARAEARARELAERRTLV